MASETTPELSQRLANLQSQVERLWQRAERNDPPVDQRLSGMADEYAAYLERWANTVERHARAVTQLEAYVSEWKDASGRIQQRFDRTESRLALFESDFHRTLSDFTREIQTAIAEMKAWPGRHTPGLDEANQWSFDDISRLHNQLRDLDGVVGPPRSPVPARQRSALPGSREFPPPMPDEVQDAHVSAHAPAEDGPFMAGVQTDREERNARMWRIAVVGLALVVIMATVFGWRLQNQVRVGAQRLQAAELESAKAAALAKSEAEAAREEAAREVATAREIAARAQTISNVLAAPDLIRFNLAATGGTSRASGQALWSRSRGLVFSASGIAPPPPSQQHQLWLITRAAPVKAGTFVPEADGAVTSVQPSTFVPRAVYGVMVTVEGTGGGETPSGEPVLTSMPPVQ